jgi:hypothetical protein
VVERKGKLFVKAPNVPYADPNGYVARPFITVWAGGSAPVTAKVFGYNFVPPEAKGKMQ